jgi:glutamine synthetase
VRWQFFRDHGISEVEAIIPDMAGTRGKIMPAEKFAETACACLSVFLQTVTGDYPRTRAPP